MARRKKQTEHEYINEALRPLAVPISSIKFDLSNAKKHNRRSLDVIKASLKTNGQAKVIVVWKERGTIAAGNGTVAAALELGWTHVAANVRSFESEDDARAYALVDNRSAEFAEWDHEILPEQLRELKVAGFEMEEFGWNPIEFDEALRAGGPPDTAGKGENEPPPLAEVPARIQDGDIIYLGDHRLICGDSRDPRVVKRLMGKEVADMVFTDPPYGVDYHGNESRESLKARNQRTDGLMVANDSLTPEETRKLVADAVSAWPLRKGGVFYVCAPSGPKELAFRYALQVDSSRALVKQTLIWNKDRFAFGRQDYHWKHETIFYGWIEGAAHYFVKDRKQNTVWDVPRLGVSKEHPTMKPIELVTRAILNSSREGGIVFDGFVGSGQTMLAAERTKRISRMIELDRRYCDTIAVRWINETGEGVKVKRGRKMLDWDRIEAVAVEAAAVG